MNYADEVQFLTDANNTDIFNKIEAGSLDTAISSIPPQVGAKYDTDPNLKQDLHINQGDRIWYLTMNLTQAPFDDVHVRKAMNWIIDKAAMQQAWGGADLGPVANHIVPDSIFCEPALRLRAVPDRREPRQRREGEAGDEGLEVRHRPRTAPAAPRPARTS